MTLILTVVNKYGIINASDSNLIDENEKLYRDGAKKTFDIPFIRSSLAIAGTYGVGPIPIDEWVNDFIARVERKLAWPPTTTRLAA